MISTVLLQQTETALTRLIEATQRQKIDKIINTPVATLETALGKLFVGQGNALIRALKPLQTFFKEASINQQFDAIFDAATEATSLQMMETLEKAYKNAILLGGTNQLAETGIKISFKLDNPRANAYIAKYGGDLISGIDDTTREDMRNLLHASIENGDSFNRLAQQIKARYQQYAVGQPQQHIRSRAHLIAVTEYGNGYQAGNYASMQVAQDSGVKILKKWSTVGDARVSEGCKANAAQDWIPLNQQFQSGHMHPLRFPGDRCVALYKRDKDASAALAAKLASKVPVSLPKTGVTSKELSKTEPPLKLFDIGKPANYKAVDRAIGANVKGSALWWNGKVTLSDKLLSDGTFRNVDGMVLVRARLANSADPKERDLAFKILVHEMLHSRSLGSGKNASGYKLGLGWEESVVEGLSQHFLENIAKDAKYTFNDLAALKATYATHSYKPWLDPLKAVFDDLDLDHGDTLILLLNKRIDQRQTYIKEKLITKYGIVDGTTRFDVLNAKLQ